MSIRKQCEDCGTPIELCRSEKEGILSVECACAYRQVWVGRMLPEGWR